MSYEGPGRWSESNRKKKARIKRLHTRMILEKREQPCVDCGVALPPPVMHLDHVRGVKKFHPQPSTHVSTGALREELEKCDVRCPNCHALRHYYEKQEETRDAI